MEKNLVLVPGAWLGAWVWKKIIPPLEKQGYNVYPITLSGMGERKHLSSEKIGMETAVQDVMNVIEYNDLDDIILVGHSFAGKVVSVVSDRMPEKIRQVLFLDAFVPENINTPQGIFDPESEYGPIPQGEIGIPLTENVIDKIGSDMKGEDRKWMLQKGTTWPIRLAKEPIVISKRFKNLRKAYIICIIQNENELNGEDKNELKKYLNKLEGPYRIIKTGHWPMVTQPEKLVRYISELSRE